VWPGSPRGTEAVQAELGASENLGALPQPQQFHDRSTNTSGSSAGSSPAILSASDQSCVFQASCSSSLCTAPAAGPARHDGDSRRRSRGRRGQGPAACSRRRCCTGGRRRLCCLCSRGCRRHGAPTIPVCRPAGRGAAQLGGHARLPRCAEGGVAGTGGRVAASGGRPARPSPAVGRAFHLAQ
jgi:hypothetical protein